MSDMINKTVLDAETFSNSGFVSSHNLAGRVRLTHDVKTFIDSSVGRVNKDIAASLAYNMQNGGEAGEKAASMITDADTLGSVFFQRQLEYIQANVFRVNYENITYREVFPIESLENAGYTSHTYRILDKSGKAKPIAANANDLPRADVYGKEVNQKIIATGVAYGANQQELASAQLTNFSLLEERAMACRRANEEYNQAVSLYGDAEHGLTGLFSNTFIAKADVPNGAGGFPEWSTKTPNEIYQDIVDIVIAQKNASRNTVVADTLALPLAQYTLIETTQKAAGTDTTILQYALRNISSLTNIVPVTQMEGVGTGGVDAMLLYKKSPDVFTYLIGMDHTFLDPQLRGLEIIVPSWATTGGTIVRRPLGLVIREKI